MKMERFRYIWLLMVVGLSLPLLAQQADVRKMSAFVRQAAADSRQYDMTRGVGGRERQLMAFVRIDQRQSDEILLRHSCQKYAQWGDIAIVKIPIDCLAGLSRETSVHRIEASRPASLMMDTTATIVRTLPVYEGATDRLPYTGKDVVVGLVDIGFDLTHPDFYDTSASRYRIGAFWDQLSKDTIDSRMPVGRDFVGGETIREVACSTDAPTMFHGTHTLGIAAGSGYDTRYRGVAYDSEICLVANLVSNNIEYVDSADYYKYSTAVDALGFKYCMDYAEAQGKPCVVSLSEGYAPYLDEEDSLYAAVLDSLTGPGRIIVASAGNGGVEKSYFNKTPAMSEAGAFIRSFRESAVYRVKTDGSLRLLLYRYGREDGLPSDTVAFQTDEVPADTLISRKLCFENDTLTVSAYRYGSGFSEDDFWLMLLQGNRTLDQQKPMALVVAGQSSAEVYGSPIYAFTDNAIDNRWTAAEKGHDINAPSCFPAVISVGATAHRLSIRNEKGETVDGYSQSPAGTLNVYSSTGPTMNGLLKPDVVAPGTNIVSAYSHYHNTESNIVARSEFNGGEYLWGVESGTSMSAPVVAGVIALWLQAKPDLMPEDVRGVLSRSCRQPEEDLAYPNNLYGYGEIDAYRGLLDVLGLTAIEGLSLHQPHGVTIKPVAGGLQLSFDAPLSSEVSIKIYNMSGVCVFSTHVSSDSRELLVPLTSLHPGIHAVQVTSADHLIQGSQLIMCPL